MKEFTQEEKELLKEIEEECYYEDLVYYYQEAEEDGYSLKEVMTLFEEGDIHYYKNKEDFIESNKYFIFEGLSNKKREYIENYFDFDSWFEDYVKENHVIIADNGQVFELLY